ncbi:MAG: hypothetical protein ACRDD8_03935 [Bacteroidales bacterium]
MNKQQELPTVGEQVLEYAQQYLDEFISRYNELDNYYTDSICRFELYVELPSNIHGLSDDVKLGIIIRVKTCNDQSAEILLAHDGKLLKPNKSISDLIKDIKDNKELIYTSDWGS